MTLKLSIDADGTTRFIYGDDVRALLDNGEARIDRASHVEPCGLLGTHWLADLAPVGGPCLGPFVTRAEALAAEVSWLDAHLGALAAVAD